MRSAQIGQYLAQSQRAGIHRLTGEIGHAAAADRDVVGEGIGIAHDDPDVTGGKIERLAHDLAKNRMRARTYRKEHLSFARPPYMPARDAVGVNRNRRRS